MIEMKYKEETYEKNIINSLAVKWLSVEKPVSLEDFIYEECELFIGKERIINDIVFIFVVEQVRKCIKVLQREQKLNDLLN